MRRRDRREIAKEIRQREEKGRGLEAEEGIEDEGKKK